MTVSLRSFGLGLPGLLERLCSRPGRWILIAEDARRCYRFWQAMAFEDGSLVTEAGSGTASKKSERLTSDQELQLADLNWSSPDRHYSPNWQRIEATTSPDIANVAEQALCTLRDVYGIDDLIGCCSSSSHRLTEATHRRACRSTPTWRTCRVRPATGNRGSE